MIYLLIHDTLADKTLSFRFKEEIKLGRIIEIFQSKYKHLKDKDLSLSINNQQLGPDWPIRKVMTDYGLKDKGKLALGLRVDSQLQELDNLDFSDLDNLGDLSDGNMTVTPEVDIDRTPAPVNLGFSQQTPLEPQEEPEVAEPVSFSTTPHSSENLPSTSIGGTNDDEFDPLADDAFSTVVPTAGNNALMPEDSDLDLSSLPGSEVDVDLDLDSFSNLVPHKDSDSSSLNKGIAPISVESSDDGDQFLDDLNDELFSNPSDEFSLMSATQTPISSTVEPASQHFDADITQEPISPLATSDSTQTGYEEFDPLADSSLDIEEGRTNNLESLDSGNPYLQDTSEGFPTIDPDGPPSTDLFDSPESPARDPFAPSENPPALEPPPDINAALDSTETHLEVVKGPETLTPEVEDEEEELAPLEMEEESDIPSQEESEPIATTLTPEENSFPEEALTDETPATEEISPDLVESGSVEEEVEKQATIPVPTPIATTTQTEPSTTTTVLSRYKRKIFARYYKQMQAMKNYPVLVSIDKEDLKPIEIEKSGKLKNNSFLPNQPIIEIVPSFPGCLSVPDRVAVNIQAAHVDCKFWITPLTVGKLEESRLEFRYQNVLIQSLRMPVRVNKNRKTFLFAFLTLITPLIYPVLNNWGIDLISLLPRWKPFQNLVFQIGGPVNFGIYLGGLFFIFTCLSYFLQRPKSNDPVQQFLDLQIPEAPKN